MSDFRDEQIDHSLRNVRLDTLVRLRWLAVLGQSAAVLVVHDGFDFEVPFWACLAVIAAYGTVNFMLRVRFRWNQRWPSRRQNKRRVHSALWPKCPIAELQAMG